MIYWLLRCADPSFVSQRKGAFACFVAGKPQTHGLRIHNLSLKYPDSRRNACYSVWRPW
jgi:hypothetical protein